MRTGRPILRWLSVLPFAFTLFVVGCGPLTIERMPAVTDKPTHERHAGKVIWHDLITDTPTASRRFYQELFGWQYEDTEIRMSGLRGTRVPYTLIRHQGHLIGGMVDQTKLATKADISQWMTVLSVADVHAAVAYARRAGATIYAEPVNLEARGDLAVIADPQGAVLALLETPMSDPVDTHEAPAGGIFWHELWADDPEAAIGFYAGFAEYFVEEHAVDEAAQPYRVIRSENRPRFGVMSNPVEDLSPVWVSYIRIADLDELERVVARVPELGGKVLLAPQERNLGGHVALIAGPSGAGIALQTWPEQQEESAE